MRTIPMSLLLTVLTAGCATGPTFNRVQPDPSGASTSVDPIAVELAQAVSRDAQPNADQTTTSAKVAGAIHRTGRVIKCAAIGAVAGLVVVPVVLALTGPGAAASGSPYPWAAFVLIGMAGGAAMALKDDKKQPCG